MSKVNSDFSLLGGPATKIILCICLEQLKFLNELMFVKNIANIHSHLCIHTLCFPLPRHMNGILQIMPIETDITNACLEY